MPSSVVVVGTERLRLFDWPWKWPGINEDAIVGAFRESAHYRGHDIHVVKPPYASWWAQSMIDEDMKARVRPDYPCAYSLGMGWWQIACYIPDWIPVKGGK